MSQSITFILSRKDDISVMHKDFFLHCLLGGSSHKTHTHKKKTCFLLKLCSEEINVSLIYSLHIDCFSRGKIQLKTDKSFKSHLKP